MDRRGDRVPAQFDELVELAGGDRALMDIASTSSVLKRSAPRSHRRRITADCGSTIAPRSSTPHGSAWACAVSALTPASDSTRTRRVVRLRAAHGAGCRLTHRSRAPVSARRVALATNADRPLLARLCARSSCPWYDYVLVTEPLTPAQVASSDGRNSPGCRRQRESVPLLPPDGRLADSLGRVRRHLSLR